ncbi:AAA family ATPase [Pseudocolwellia sp. HL-MZ19]|uniref:AAA family ATPase n=1 Tax=unclassified Pseudocolwellia TaxID=2848178 RepID=UPI003CEFE5FD
MNYTKVIAVSGASGSGKTTIVKLLAEKLSCPFLLFDDHTSNDTYPKSMSTWLKDGANVSVIKTPKLVNALDKLVVLDKNRYIFVEEPFGKERKSISTLIDYVILLDQPLELCLSRIIKRHTNQSNIDPVNSVSNFLDKYDDHMRDVYISTVNQVRVNCDLIINKTASIKQTVDVISKWLQKQTNKQINKD